MPEEKEVEVRRVFRRAAKIHFLKQYKIDTDSAKKGLEDLKSKLSTLKKLEVKSKKSKEQRMKTKEMKHKI